jgi:hypothetical protein
MGTLFDRSPVEVLPGDGVVVRRPGLICFVPRARMVSAEDLSHLIGICDEVAALADRPDVGRLLARRLAGWLAQQDDPVTFGMVSVTGDDLVVFAQGDVQVGTGTTVLVSGAESASWADRVLAPPPEGIWLAARVADAGQATGSPLLDLRDGTVPGGGVVLGASPPPGGAPVLDRPAVSDTSPRLRRVEPPVVAPPPVDPERLPPPRRHEPIAGSPSGVEPRPALSMPGAGPDDQHDHDAVPTAEGFLCSRGHLNDPRSLFCVACGIRMDQGTKVPSRGPRPPLGLLVFDDGSTYTIDAEYVIGREPETDERVRQGTIRGITVDDPTGRISRAHAEIRIDGWDVLVRDRRSTNGTHSSSPGGTPVWTPLPAEQNLRLIPGTKIGMGGRFFTFESSASHL